jgi:hypothetical protein
VYTAAFLNRMSSSLLRSQDSPVYAAFGWAARSMTSVLHHGRAPAFPSFVSMVDLNGRCCSRVQSSQSTPNSTADATPRRASDGLLSVTITSAIHPLQIAACYYCISGPGTAGRSASVPSCHAHACRPRFVYASKHPDGIGLVLSHSRQLTRM